MIDRRRKQVVVRFKKFLAKNNAYNKFIRNLENEDNYFKNEYSFNNLYDFLTNQRYNQFVDYAFDWDDTPERFVFWEDLNHKWTKILKKYYED